MVKRIALALACCVTSAAEAQLTFYHGVEDNVDAVLLCATFYPCTTAPLSLAGARDAFLQAAGVSGVLRSNALAVLDGYPIGVPEHDRLDVAPDGQPPARPWQNVFSWGAEVSGIIVTPGAPPAAPTSAAPYTLDRLDAFPTFPWPGEAVEIRGSQSTRFAFVFDRPLTALGLFVTFPSYVNERRPTLSLWSSGTLVGAGYLEGDAPNASYPGVNWFFGVTTTNTSFNEIRYEGADSGDPIHFTLPMIAAVPEPATLALVGSGVLLLGAWARRRRS